MHFYTEYSIFVFLYVSVWDHWNADWLQLMMYTNIFETVFRVFILQSDSVAPNWLKKVNLDILCWVISLLGFIFMGMLFVCQQKQRWKIRWNFSRKQCSQVSNLLTCSLCCWVVLCLVCQLWFSKKKKHFFLWQYFILTRPLSLDVSTGW